MIRDIFKHKSSPGYGGGHPYVSPYLLEILSTRSGAPNWASATGSLNSNTNRLGVSVAVSCSRAASAYCLGDDGLLHLLGANTVRVEPTGLLVEGASTNVLSFSNDFSPARIPVPWRAEGLGAAAPTISTTYDTTYNAPDGTATAWKIDFPACGPADYSLLYTALGGTGTSSIYLRTATGQSGTIYFGDFSAYATCNVTDQWQRFTFSNTAGWWFLGYDPGQGASPAGGPITLWMWGAQAETGMLFATSYIPTTGAAATRDADIVTVANPLNPSNPGTWRVGGTGIPYGSWTPTGAPGIILSCGANGSPNNWRIGNDTGTVGRFDVTDGAGNALTNAGFGSYSSGVAGSYLGIDTAGVLTTVPGGGSVSGTGTGLLTQPASVNIGSPVGFPDTFRFWGHLTDILVDNT